LNTNPVIITRQFGNAYVIDPLFVAASATNISAQAETNTGFYAFPASAIRNFPRSVGSWNYYKDSSWDAWRAGTGASASDRAWPIRRLTLQGANGWWMDSATAAHYFMGSDDLATDLPSRDDRPSRQNWDAIPGLSNPTPMNRQWAGDYSWIVSVVPTTNASRNALASNSEGSTYDVSVVVFYKRPLPTRISGTRDEVINDFASYERTVSASVVSTGLNGGELLLQSFTESVPGNPFDNLRKGEWIMLCGPHPNSSVDMSVSPPTGDPQFVMNWYQVLTIETEGLPSNQRLIAVRGPQWPWAPTASPGYGASGVSNDLCVGICRGAVAVHTRTMRLESSRGDGMALVSGTPGVTSRNAIP
jgi:hypothetical protein